MFTRQFASEKKSTKSSFHLMTVKQENEETLREYVAKFNMIALETLGVDAKIKIHALIQGLHNGHFFRFIGNERAKRFGRFVGKNHPYIHLEEARVVRREEGVRLGQRSDGKLEKEEVRGPMVKNLNYQGRARYDTRPREYIGTPGSERAFILTRDPCYLPALVPPKESTR